MDAVPAVAVVGVGNMGWAMARAAARRAATPCRCATSTRRARRWRDARPGGAAPSRPLRPPARRCVDRRGGRRRADRGRAVRRRRCGRGAARGRGRAAVPDHRAGTTPSAAPRALLAQGLRLHRRADVRRPGSAPATGTMSLMVACADAAVRAPARAASRRCRRRRVPHRRARRATARAPSSSTTCWPASTWPVPPRRWRWPSGRARRRRARWTVIERSSGQSWIGTRPHAPRHRRRPGAARAHDAAGQGHPPGAGHGRAGSAPTTPLGAQAAALLRARLRRWLRRRSTTPACSNC